MAAAARNWGSYIRRELDSINTASRATDMKTLREIVDTLRVVVNRCCAAEENAEGLEEPPTEAEAGAAAGNLAAEQAAEPHEWVRNGNGKDVWYRNTVTDEIAWEVPPGGILRNEGAANERPPPPAAEGAVPRFATAANRAAARGGVPPPSPALGNRAGRLAPNMEVCDGVTPEDCRAARLKLRRANSQLAASAASSARNLAAEPVTPPGTPPSSLAASPVAGQSGGKRRGRINRKTYRRKCNYRRTNRRYMER
jgi:hypothetical protein